MFDHLFKPISVNGMILKNRIIATPTGDDFEEKAMGGAALVIAGHAIVEPGRSSFASPEEPYPFAKYEREETRKKDQDAWPSEVSYQLWAECPAALH